MQPQQGLTLWPYTQGVSKWVGIDLVKGLDTNGCGLPLRRRPTGWKHIGASPWTMRPSLDDQRFRGFRGEGGGGQTQKGPPHRMMG